MTSRLLIVTTVPETFATILRHQPRALSKLFNVCLATSKGGEFQQLRASEGVEVHAVPMNRGISPFRDIVSVVRMVQLIRSLRPDIVHSYTPKAGLVAMLAGWWCRVPVRIHTFTGLIFPTETGLRQQLLIWVDRLICSCATRVVPEGDGVRRDLQRFRITKKGLAVIGHGNIAGVDTAYYAASAPGVAGAAASLRDGLGIGEEDFVFCFIGRLNRDKGVSELVRAFTNLTGSVHLIVVGAQDLTAPVNAEVNIALQTHERIHKLGFMEDIRPALSAANVLVLPSYREGFPNAVLQACSMQRPVIATDISGCNEIIEPGSNGWLVPVRHVNALQAAMREAANTSSAVLDSMGLEGRRRIEERFEQRSHWQRMVLFYQECINRIEK